jgi:hypothetical protein
MTGKQLGIYQIGALCTRNGGMNVQCHVVYGGYLYVTNYDASGNHNEHA